MNTIVKSLLYLAKALNFWIFVIPSKFKILATFMHFGLMYLIFGTYDMSEIRYHIFEGNQIAQLSIFFIFGLPAFMGFVYFMSQGSSGGSNINSEIDRVIAHRNNMMSHASSSEAYKIMKKTAHLDVIKSSPEFRDAVIGFNATKAKDGPSEAYKDIMKS